MEEFVRVRPAGALRTCLRSYVGYRSDGVEPAVHRGLPSPYLTVVIALDDPLHVAQHPDPFQPGGMFDALIGGLHTAPALIAHEGRQSGVQLDLSPLASRALLGLPAGELAGIDVHAEDLLGPAVRLLRERLLAAPGWPERFVVLDEVLSSSRGETVGPPPEVAQAWRLLLASGGQARVDDLARQVGWSARHLASRFRTEVGLTPKVAARVVRFAAVRRRLQARPETRLSDLAAQCGYYDQAHLAREFRELAGLAPSAWLRAEGIGNVQAAAASGSPH